VTVPIERQKASFLLCKRLIDRNYQFDSNNDGPRLLHAFDRLFKNLNYSLMDSEEYHRYVAQIDELEKAAYAGQPHVEITS
jgi:V/A-type H+/Na+-transporting ATPase subunit A